MHTDTPVFLPLAPTEHATTHIVDQNGSGDFTTIQAAIDAAGNGDVIIVNAGTYTEGISITSDNLALRANGTVIIDPDTSSHGVYVNANQVLVDGFEITGVTGEEFLGYSAAGIVVEGSNITLSGNIIHNNGHVGIQTLEGTANLLIDGGQIYDNTSSGIGLGGGSHITIQGTEIFNTGVEADGDGNYQYQGILMDNSGDVRLIGGQPTFIEGQEIMSDILITGIELYGHLGYGIRISAEDPDTSARESGRIDTHNFYLMDSDIYDNGSALSSWVGGLYHLGGVLLQHIQNGAISGNYFHDNYTWGIDLYNSSNITIEENLFFNNNAGDSTEGVTLESVGLEVNGGQNNLIQNNISTGQFVGLVSNWIPDSGDDFSTEYVQGSHTFASNVSFNNGEADFEVNSENIDRTIENNLFEHIPNWHIEYLTELVPTFEGANILGEDPRYVDPISGDFSLRASSPITNLDIGFTPNPLLVSTTLNIIEGTTSQDILSGTDGSDSITGGAGNDRLTGHEGNDIVEAGAGSDQIWAGAGDIGSDRFSGGTENDTIGGGAGNDTLVGGSIYDTSPIPLVDAGSDIIFGGSGNDLIIAGSFNFAESFVLETGSSTNTAYAGTGNDTVHGDLGADILGGGEGSDFISGGGGNDTLYGGRGDADTNNDTLDGGDGTDIIYAGVGNDAITGGTMNDLLFGGSGIDTLDGGTGDDTIFGGSGDDSITGGGGKDTFGYVSDFGEDIITDFEVAENGGDTLDLGSIGNLSEADVTNSAVFFDDSTLLQLTGHGEILLVGVTENDFNSLIANDQLLL